MLYALVQLLIGIFYLFNAREVDGPKSYHVLTCSNKSIGGGDANKCSAATVTESLAGGTWVRVDCGELIPRVPR